ncbi:MAG: hypothetical protein Q8936_19295 [Bacillota bacterium]|nr:hypothetical protein [Bacillota bacterium]
MFNTNEVYGDIEASLKTGDIILFHGGESVSKLIETLENTPWTHVGMIVHPSDIGLSEKCGNRPLLWHSTPKLNIEDVEIESKDYGPEIVYLDEVLNLLKSYNYLVVVRKLDTERTAKMMDSLKQFINKVHNDNFPTEPQLFLEYIIGKIMNAINRLFKKRISYNSTLIVKSIENTGLKFIVEKLEKKPYLLNLHTEFCSELVAQTYIAMDLLSEEEVPQSFSPKSFSSQENLPLNNAKLEKEITISSPPKELCSNQ